ncbi:hypothetical protein [Alloactinosynnema sp. L-07]|uniref:ATP-grasp domain-containing protein n=1 Tax=Alloactinosynnema sp. L-07 TaxID=1653480 RepID=UPI00065EFB52|nr:hypothetical protein [Alloactinosynnema sp. L-07]CRK61881.1 hypothetical protein [Alloactinosynnema sp. L-07]
MAVPRIGVCHAPGAAANLRELYVAARDVCEVVLLVRESVARRHPDLVGLAGKLFECHEVADAPDPAALSTLDLQGVTTFHDEELDVADALDAVVRGAPAPANPWDKLVQRRVLAAAGIGRVRAVAVDLPDDLLAGFAHLDGPCVLKPRRAAGGDGIAFLDDDSDVAAQLARRTKWSGLLLETAIAPHRHPSGDPWLGDLLSVETVTVGGERTHLGVLDKLPVAVARGDGPHGTDSVSVQGDILPSKLPDDDLRGAIALTDRALDALGVGSRITHTELRITPDGLEVLEVNGRLAGHTARLFRLAGGPDLVALALRAALGQPPAGPVSLTGAAAGLFPAFPTRSGPVLSATSRRALRSLPGVAAVDDLAVMGAARAASDHRLANLTVAGADRAAVDAGIDGVLRAIAAMFAADGVTVERLFAAVLAERA